MSYRRNHKPFISFGIVSRTTQRFLSAALIEHPMRGILREGSPVRVTFKRRVGAYRGKYKGVVTAVGESAFTGKHMVRVLVNRAPSDQAWMVGRPMYVAKDLVVVLPTKRRASYPREVRDDDAHQLRQLGGHLRALRRKG